MTHPRPDEIECMLWKLDLPEGKGIQNLAELAHWVRVHPHNDHCNLIGCQPCGFRVKRKCMGCVHFSRCTQTLSLCNGQEEWEPRLYDQ